MQNEPSGVFSVDIVQSFIHPDSSSVYGEHLRASTAPACPGSSVFLKEILKFLIVHLTRDEMYCNATSTLDSL